MARPFLAKMLYSATALRAHLPQRAALRWLEVAALRRFLDEQRINLVLDVGANEGQFVAKVRRLGYQGPVVSFEPDPRVFRILRHRYAGDPRWRGFPYALGERDEEELLNVNDNSQLSSFLPTLRGQPPEDSVEVSVRRLDGVFQEVVEEIPHPRALLKTDTQGYDLKVLEGAEGVYPWIAGIFTEISVLPLYRGAPTLEEAMEAYEKAGYDPVELWRSQRAVDGRLLEMDGLFIRRDLVAGAAVEAPSASGAG